MKNPDLREMLNQALIAGLKAGKDVMEVDKGSLDIEIKKDGSPVTLADKKANELIRSTLAHTGIPIISEENQIEVFDQRKNWEWVWIVDPLDGTKEFIEANGEFTVNIALVKAGNPVLGVIVAPALEMACFGLEGEQAYKISDIRKLHNKEKDIPGMKLGELGKPVQAAPAGKDLSVAVSRSNYDTQTRNFIKKVIGRYEQVNLISRGSSLKFCDLAENHAGIYPRFSNTYEWDIAAGHAIIKAAGGEVYSLISRLPIKYNKDDMLNPAFIAFADKNLSDRYFSEFSP